ncbi:hypothetical protein F4780DRAFT_787619 [Xylariomycetidae sp. FL0641]|nr:hypothetical protein F4780DRAFT_787619 [Xylariomycetidae sp. FL0641]
MKSSLDQDTEGLLPKGSHSDTDESLPVWHRGPESWRTALRKHRCAALVIAALAFTNVATLAFTFFSLGGRQEHYPCVNEPPSGVAPTLAHLAQKQTAQLLNVTFYPYDNLFRKHDSVEADELWADYAQSDAGYIMISKEEAPLADIDPDRHAYIDRPDLGMVGYPVLPEAVHEMHCVNLLRRNLYYNKEHSVQTCRPPFCVDPELEDWDILHIDHCLEYIRTRIACTADLGVVPFLWYHHSGKLTGDNTRMHTCSNYDALKNFVAEKSVPEPPPGTLKPPEGAYVIQDYT